MVEPSCGARINQVEAELLLPWPILFYLCRKRQHWPNRLQAVLFILFSFDVNSNAAEKKVQLRYSLTKRHKMPLAALLLQLPASVSRYSVKGTMFMQKPEVLKFSPVRPHVERSVSFWCLSWLLGNFRGAKCLEVERYLSAVELHDGQKKKEKDGTQKKILFFNVLQYLYFIETFIVRVLHQILNDYSDVP